MAGKKAQNAYTIGGEIRKLINSFALQKHFDVVNMHKANKKKIIRWTEEKWYRTKLDVRENKPMLQLLRTRRKLYLRRGTAEAKKKSKAKDVASMEARAVALAEELDFEIPERSNAPAWDRFVTDYRTAAEQVTREAHPETQQRADKKQTQRRRTKRATDATAALNQKIKEKSGRIKTQNKVNKGSGVYAHLRA
ncbi:hypothetical protein BDY24DRAFT_376455 [Mrakia frigida]|uniref:uncharacterized protein n=1 Tax=Mrakia frigida TaxID=29902 RepID=UPI003FCBF79E